MSDMMERFRKAQQQMGPNWGKIFDREKVCIDKVTFKFGDGCLIVFSGHTDDGEMVAFVGGVCAELAIQKAAGMEMLPWKASVTKS